MKHNLFKTKTPEDGSIDDTKSWHYEVLKQFRLIFKATQQHSQWVENQFGVSSAQLWILWELSKTPDLKVTELAKAMLIHHSTACSLLDKLAKKDLIKRERKNQDQRVVTLNLTERGKELISQTPVPPQGILQHALFNMPDNELEALAGNLGALIKEMGITDEVAAMKPLSSIRDT